MQIIPPPPRQMPPLDRWEIFVDFEASGVFPPFFSSQNGTGAQPTGANPDASNRVGILSLETGTTTTGRAAILAPLALFFGGGEAEFQATVQIPDLSDGTETYSFRIGFIDSATADATDGVYFEYDTGQSANWRICAANNGSRSKTTTSVAVAADAWINLRIVVNAAGTSAEFFVNGVSVGTISAQIPATAGRLTGPGAMILKSAGSTNRAVWIDWVWSRILFTTPRT